MKLRTKISVIILVIWAVMATVFYFGSQRIILNSYVRLEDEMISNNLDRMQSALNQTISSVNYMTKDWSIWDDTYNFIEDKNTKYIKANLTLSTFQATDIDMVLFFNKAGILVESLAVNEDKTTFATIPNDVLAALTPKSKLVYQPDAKSSVKGFLSVPSGILIVAAHSIVTSEGTGPVRGTVIMAKRLTNKVLAEVESAVKVDSTLFRLPLKNSNNRMNSIYRSLLNETLITSEKSDQQLTGYRFLNDINGNPIAILQINLPRKIYQIGLETIHYSNIVVFGYSLAITILLWMLLQYLIVKRIERLNRHITKMGTDEKFFVRLIENVSDEVSSVAALYQQATHDPLTGLANRNLLYQAFNHFAGQMTGLNRKIVILFIDLDHFKRVNDTLGHEVGDQLLVNVANRINSSLRENDLAARLGGDEFVVMLVDVEKDDVEHVTNRLFEKINKPISNKEHDIYITASMGVCVYPNDGMKIETLIKQADMALYHTKEHGRNGYAYYSETLSKQIGETHKKEIELQKAIDEKQLVLVYQPIYDLKSKQIASFEALIRWQHPTKGLLGADDIIPLAEKTELIKPIGEWVMNTVCLQIKSWQDQGLPVVPVAVNISSSQIRGDSLSKKVIKSLQDANLDSQYLHIEITETGFIELTPKLLSELKGLRSNGIIMAIDDFGTGYSGLGYLKRLPVAKLKIDRTFIRDIHTDPDDKAIVLAIIAIAHQLDLKVTAEGVETIEQYNFLCYHQVDEAQGNYLAEPLSLDECEKLLSGENPEKSTIK